MLCETCGDHRHDRHMAGLSRDPCERCALVEKQAPWLVQWVKDVVSQAIRYHEEMNEHEGRDLS